MFQHSLPNVGEGALKHREDKSLLGTTKETTLLKPAVPFYKNFAVDCSGIQISVDIFLFNSQYCDIATLSSCSKYTGGNMFYYPGFNAGRVEDVKKLTSELAHLLSRPLGLEAVLRVRASNGIKMTGFHGNFFLRSTDLLSLPNVNPDNSYGIEMAITESLTASHVCFQTALLHTSSNGERRIRVLTLCVPVSSNMAEFYAGVDQFAVAALLAKKAVDRSLTSNLEDSREALFFKLVDIICFYKALYSSQMTHDAQVVVSRSISLLPILILGMIKNVFLANLDCL